VKAEPSFSRGLGLIASSCEPGRAMLAGVPLTVTLETA
jgi:hypothetical protein